MDTDQTPAASPVPVVGKITLFELWACLKAGVFDFRAAPQFGIFFSAVYVAAGFLMVWLGAGHVTWVLATSLGFPLAAPFAAVGLYEVSRRLEADETLKWRDILGVVWQERTRQVPWIGAFILFFFLVWTFLAHMIFAVFMGVSTMTNVSTTWDVFLTPNGLTMLAVEGVLGGVLAFLLFSLTAVSLPLVLDREIDFMTAMLLSLRCVTQNIRVMLVWAFIVAVLTFVALLPWFLGLIVVLPVLGHATGHIYRRSLSDPI
jgi:uncharacterized membrane protein